MIRQLSLEIFYNINIHHTEIDIDRLKRFGFQKKLLIFAGNFFSFLFGLCLCIKLQPDKSYYVLLTTCSTWIVYNFQINKIDRKQIKYNKKHSAIYCK